MSKVFWILQVNECIESTLTFKTLGWTFQLPTERLVAKVLNITKNRGEDMWLERTPADCSKQVLDTDSR
jgi:hypothetical protein